MAPDSPAVARWELSYRTRRRRDEMGITGPQIAKALKFSATYWPKVERDQRILSEDKLIQLLELLDFTAEEQAELVGLRQLARQSGWWSQYEGLFDEQQLRFYGLEYGAEEIATVEALLIPGLLQTAEYARALYTADTAFIRQIEVQQRVDARMKRQKRLDDEDPVKLSVVVSEAALRQETGSHDILQNQLRHLVAMIEQHETTLKFRVLPFTSHTGAIRAFSSFHILHFARPPLPTLAWTETPVHGELVEDQEQTRSMSTTFGHLQTESLAPDKSLNFLETLID
ncbi:helix-turn-helix domain-containing protein [Nocardia noduli]|uniref:helix-turn-helix domain-containing protein n=1 Tax=Nocardia noduli TaxID=2815722 RepID=UPI001C24593A|nr:Scr1 family TA system antitoxin-like transcriptional regulator [Nocardia noduli]